MSEPAEEGEYGLVMPFVVCKSNDGPFDDSAFVAGAIVLAFVPDDQRPDCQCGECPHG